MNRINRFIAASCVLAASLLAQQSPVAVVNTVADLLAYDPQGVATNRLVMLSGYYAANDGGEGEFRHSVYPYTTNYGTVFPAYGYVAGVGPVWVRQTRYAEPVNVKWFGATGNGTTVDTAATQAALTAGAGKTVYFPQGTYLLDDAGAANTYSFLQMGTTAFNNTRLVGEPSSVLKAKSTSTRKYILNIGSTDGAGAGTVFPADVVIDGLTFDCNAQARGGAASYLSSIFAYPKLAGEATSFTVKNCKFINIGYKALVVGGVSRAWVEDCSFTGPLYAPDSTASVLLFGGNIQTSAVKVEGCHFSDVYCADLSNLAIQCVYASDYASLLVADCTYTNVAKAVDCRQPNALVTGQTVVGGAANGCAGDVSGAYLFLAVGTAGNVLTNVVFDGIVIDGAPHQALFTGIYTKGMRIADVSSTAPADAVVGDNSYVVSAFRPQTGCDDTVISDCYFGLPKTGSGGAAYGYGVYTVDGASRTILDNVAFDGATYLARYDSGDAATTQLIVRDVSLYNRNATTYLFVNNAGGSNNTGGGYVIIDGELWDADASRSWGAHVMEAATGEPATGTGKAALYPSNNGSKTVFIAKDSDGTTNTLTAFTGDSGSGGTRGLVPAPAAGDAAAGKYLKADGAWAAPTGALYGAGTNVVFSGSTNINVPNMVGDTGSGGTAGVVPAPAAGDAAAEKTLGAGGAWVLPKTNYVEGFIGTLYVTNSAGFPAITATNSARLLSATASKVLVTDANQYITNSTVAIGDLKTTRVGVVREVWVPASAMNPFATAGAAFTTNTWATTTDGQAIEAYDFDDATDEAVQFTLSLPLAWDGADPKMKIFWKPVAEEDGYTNIWGAVAGSLANNDDGGNTLGTPATVEDVGLTSTNKLHISPAITVDVGNTPTAGDMIWFKVYRDANAALDELVGDARLLGVMIQYTETTTEPSAW